MNPEEIRPVVLEAPIRRERTDVQIERGAAHDRLPVGARDGRRLTPEGRQKLADLGKQMEQLARENFSPPTRKTCRNTRT